MPVEERKRRWEALNSNVRDQDVRWWRERFTEALLDVPCDPPEGTANQSR
jgi:trehalose-6-phosphate synthase